MSEHELWNELGNLYFLSGSYGQAVHAYRRSIQLDDSFGRPYSNLALAYVQQGKFEEAIDLYRRSIELLLENNEKAISWNRLGNVYRYLKDYQNALHAYQQADELNPDSAETEDQPGWVSEAGARPQPDPEADIIFPAEAQPQQAESSITEALAQPMEDLPIMSDQSEIATDDVVASWALTELTPYQQNVSTSPDTSPLTTWGPPNFGEDADPFGLEDPDTEVDVPDADGDDLTKWLPVPEDVPQDVIEDRHELEEAIEEVQEVQEAPLEGADVPAPEPEPAMPSPELPPTPAIIPSVVVRREITDRVEQGERTIEVEVAVDVEERPVQELSFAMRQPAEAVAQLPAEKDETPAATEAEAKVEVQAADNELAVAAEADRSAEEMRKMESDIAKYRRVVQINPRNAHAWDTLGNLYKSAGQYSESLTAYQQAVATDPGRALYHHHLGLLYACLGRTEDAICSFQRVIEIDPSHSLAHATLGGYYRKMGLEELAQKHIGKAMKSIFDSENEYNRACLAAICGNADEALELLRVALTNKQTYVDWILRDPDLDFIRQDPRFRQLISDYSR